MNEFTYKGYPLLRKGLDMIYGKADGKYVCMMNVIESHQSGGVEVSDKVGIFLVRTEKLQTFFADSEKRSERESLIDALELASSWLKKTA